MRSKSSPLHARIAGAGFRIRVVKPGASKFDSHCRLEEGGMDNILIFPFHFVGI